MSKKSKKSKKPQTGIVHTGDCIVLMQEIPEESIDLVVADPPYNLGIEYGEGVDDSRPVIDYLSWTAKWIDEAARLLKPTGSLWVFISDELVGEVKIIAESRFALICAEDIENPIARTGQALTQRHHVVWYYTFGMNAAKRLTRSHTHILHFVKHAEHKWNADDPAVRVPSARQLVYADKRANPKGRLPDDTWILRPQDPRADFDPIHATWHFPRVCGTFKEKREGAPNQLPEPLVERIIRFCTDPGDTVLDPFLGTGTTARVAARLERAWIGMEIRAEAAETVRTAIESDPTQKGDTGASG